MHTLKDVKARFPDCYSAAGDLIVRLDGQNVVLADLGNGSFNLTPKGQELMAAQAAPAEVPPDPKPEAKPEPVKRGRKPKVAPADPTADLDDIFA